MEKRNENSLSMAARLAWKALVVTSTIAAISDGIESFKRTWSKSVEDVDAVIAHNQEVLEEISTRSRKHKPSDYRWMTRPNGDGSWRGCEQSKTFNIQTGISKRLRQRCVA